MLVIVVLRSQSHAQLFSEDFDDQNAGGRWVVNTTGLGRVNSSTTALGPLDTNFDRDADGIVDDTSDFGFDYSSVGIPSAPNSTAGSTIGMKLQANLFSNVFGGFSVSPIGLSIQEDFSLRFDYWGNAQGSPIGSGTTNLSYYGFGTTGVFANSPGASDGVWFANTIDGDSGADYRIYDHDQRQFSYQVPGSSAYDPSIDGFATFPLDRFGNPTRNAQDSAFLQSSFGGVTPPAAMQSLFPAASLSTPSIEGALGWEWHEMEIRKEDDIATLFVDGLQILSLDTQNLPPLPGSNILFGHSDVNFSSSNDPNSSLLLFTLIDNVSVTIVPEAGSLSLLLIGTFIASAYRRR